MNRNDYELFAAAIKKTKPAPSEGAAKRVQWNKDVKAIATIFAANNARFDQTKFYTACDFLT